MQAVFLTRCHMLRWKTTMARDRKGQETGCNPPCKMHGGFFILALAVPPCGNNHKEKGGKRIWFEKFNPKGKYSYIFIFARLLQKWIIKGKIVIV
jgi:hypothetical protein